MLYVLGNNLSESFRTYFNNLAATRPDFALLPASIGQFRSREPFSEALVSPVGQEMHGAADHGTSPEG